MKPRFLIFFLLIVSTVFADGHKRETRAVWVATNFRLDWPPHTFDQTEQKNSLRQIFNNINRKKLNAVYFQVRSNGTVMFKSETEPFSPYFTGQVDRPPDYDPLALAIKEAHKRGLELHAWVNVFRCFTGTETEALESPKHIFNKHPEWAIEARIEGKKTYWLDPGLPEARNYLADLFAEIVANYDVDGIHLDFIRYPNTEIEDDFSYGLYGEGKPRNEWRRENITKFMKLLSSKIRAIKPFVKIGVTPIGIYKNIGGAYGTQGFSSVYQDAREWLRRGYADYAVPQIYWDISENPKFKNLARDWISNSAGKNIILGIAAYKPEVKKEIEEQIAFARKINAAGVAFFRYGNIKDYNFKSFRTREFPADYVKKTEACPPPPKKLTVTVGKKITLAWLPPDKRESPVKYYALYLLSAPDENAGEKKLFQIVGAERNSVSFSIVKPKRLKYYFAVKSVGQFWNESRESSNVVEFEPPQIKDLIDEIMPPAAPLLIKEKTGYKLFLLSGRKEEIKVTATADGKSSIILINILLPGENIFTINDDLSEYDEIIISRANSGGVYRMKIR
ncbi:MAG: family 10 glycosylhydrolase [Chlorobi bacterium]|nr:family 10 glycosylhydrolase [Chlorobiota bacterium]